MSPMHVGNLDQKALGHAMALAKGGPMPALTMAARKAFWSLPNSYLSDLARLLGLTTFAGSLLDKLTKLVQHVLGEQSAEDLLAILSQRAFGQDDCWDTDWMSSQPLLAELGAEELEAVKDSYSSALSIGGRTQTETALQ